MYKPNPVRQNESSSRDVIKIRVVNIHKHDGKITELNINCIEVNETTIVFEQKSDNAYLFVPFLPLQSRQKLDILSNFQ